jgi:hypothetical protein
MSDTILETPVPAATIQREADPDGYPAELAKESAPEVDVLAPDYEIDLGAADIEYVPTVKVKIRIDLDRLTWEDFLAFETLAQDSENPDSLKRMVAMACRTVVEPADPMKLPFSTLMPVMDAMTKGIEGRSSRKN